ncbi:hypothetical protein, partial [Streptomyces sp. NPDC050804]|uniref:hypothetical protein n=1 Tax=Streptomyces sp. NPDC050804 TaxID=3154745 RepID=UPI00341CB14A
LSTPTTASAIPSLVTVVQTLLFATRHGERRDGGAEGGSLCGGQHPPTLFLQVSVPKCRAATAGTAPSADTVASRLKK